MISRFNLDQKRLNYYEDLEQFNKDFININSSDNKTEFIYDIEKPTVLLNKEKTLKLSIYKNDRELSYILFSNHSISIMPNEKIKIHKALKDISKYEIFNLNIE
tara:strand:- start:711 stop:1022 length:312 start_codon:yes stop_codon:yes gene_type:complete